jgi:hypothetical protein
MTRLPAGTVESKASSISSRPSPRILRFENHDEALRFWRESAGADRILVHIDAHHDMWWVDAGQRVTIANFITPALQEGILREIYWVVPGGSWESAENRRQIFHHLHRLHEELPIRPARLEVARDHISTTLFGKPLHICSAEGLPKFGESVLLDLDVDYLLFPRVTYGTGDPHPQLPWRWPADLVQILAARGVQSDLVTIAYSIEGGYTPLRWKYLGDELEVRLEANGSSETARGMDLVRTGAESAASGDRAAAEQEYVEAAALLPHLAAPLWHLAFFILTAGVWRKRKRYITARSTSIRVMEQFITMKGSGITGVNGGQPASESIAVRWHWSPGMRSHIWGLGGLIWNSRAGAKRNRNCNAPSKSIRTCLTPTARWDAFFVRWDGCGKPSWPTRNH